jgi:hypothetical protein
MSLIVEVCGSFEIAKQRNNAELGVVGGGRLRITGPQGQHPQRRNSSAHGAIRIALH